MIIKSLDHLQLISKKIADQISEKDCIFLVGEIGVGKTTFVKYLINDFQVKFDEKITEVTSPTFNIMNEYKIGHVTIQHYDLYRLKSEQELNDLNLFEKNNESILLVEWPQIIKKKPVSLIELSFVYENDYQNRFIKIIN